MLVYVDIGAIAITSDPFPSDFGMVKDVHVTVTWKNFSADNFSQGSNGYALGSIVVSRDSILGNADDEVMKDDRGVAPSLASGATKTTSFSLHYINMPDPGGYYIGMKTDNFSVTSGQGPIRSYISPKVSFTSLSDAPLPNGMAMGTSGDDVIQISRVESRTIAYINNVPYEHNESDSLLIDGGAGNDRILVDRDYPYPIQINGGGGNDYIVCGAGNDSVLGGAGKDTIYGGDGSDRLKGNGSIDVIYGEGDSDRLYGGEHNDRIDAGGGKNRLYGEAGDDVLIGGSSADRLYGGDGNDLLLGGKGVDNLDGGSGTDTAKEDSSDHRIAVEVLA